MRSFSLVLALVACLAVALALNAPPRNDNFDIMARRGSQGKTARTKAQPVKPAVRLRQATREQIITRAQITKTGPAKRQTSSTGICGRTATGTVPYAVFPNAAFLLTTPLAGGGLLFTLNNCFLACERNTACAGVTYNDVGGGCSLYSSVSASSIQPAIGLSESEIRGRTCAQIRTAFPNTAAFTCCDALRT